MIRLCVLFALLGCHAAPRASTPSRDIVADAKAAATEFDAAQLRADRAAMDRFLAADFIFVRGSGKVAGRDEFIAAFTDPDQKLEPFQITNPIALRLGDATVLIGGDGVITGTAGGKPFVERLRYADIFQWRDGRWQVIYVQVTPQPAP